MASKIKVSAERMTADRSNIAELFGTINNDIDALLDSMRALAACWEGPAWNAFQGSVNLSIEDMQEVCTFFSEYLAGNASAEGIYRKCETDNRNRFKSIRI